MDTDTLLAQARALGDALLQHERVQSYLRVRATLESDREAARLLEDHHRHLDRLQQLEMQRKPIEAADKRRLAELESQLAGHELIKQWMRVQADYIELMNRLNDAIEQPLVQRLSSPAAAGDA